MTCAKCGKTISSDEVGLTCKLINRGSTQFYCFDCLSAMFHASRNTVANALPSTAYANEDNTANAKASQAFSLNFQGSVRIPPFLSPLG